MEVAVIGIHKRFCCDDFFSKVYTLVSKSDFSADDTVLLITCNRIEIYLATPFLSERHPEILEKIKQPFCEDIEKQFYTFMGYDVLKHLAKVTSGLDSLICGESDIQCQVKKAYETMGKHLNKDGHFLFQKALHISKKLRELFDIKPTKSLQDQVALELAAYIKPGAKIAFLGNSDLNQKIYQRLKSLGFKVIIFSSNKPKEDSLFCDAEYHDYSKLAETGPFDGVIAASKNRIIGNPLNLSDGAFICDLSLPKMIFEKGSLYFDLSHFEKTLSKQALKQISDKYDAVNYISENVQRLASFRHARLESIAG